ncbi:MAG: hydrogenase expression/formation protein HypE [Bacteroidales bacterium]|nr:hydrogenase expression/formation protein HypE [Bacteroidales bacterium]
MIERVTLGHGGGGRQAQLLILDRFTSRFGMQGPLTDSALLSVPDGLLAFTTDSYVVSPLFFPGGNIGKLAVCGTVNDLAVSGAEPRYLSAAFIIEEGFSLEELDRIVASMVEEAVTAGVRIVTGDTKVVEKGQCDGLFINTAGVGILAGELRHVSSASEVKEGDRLIINGPPGDHAVTILAARRNLSFDIPLASDCASLNHLVKRVTEVPGAVHFMRDLTRGGLAAVLNELAGMTGCGITIDEASVPVNEPVRGMCEILGFDPFCLASEGRLLVVAAPEEAERIAGRMREDPLGRGASIIGTITSARAGRVILNSTYGGQRFLEMPSGQLLPRIC